MTGTAKPAAMMTAAQVAALFSVDPHTVLRWGRAGKLTGWRQPGSRLTWFRASEVTALYAKAAS
jgi:predicted site-specific integrase-resolvase